MLKFFLFFFEISQRADLKYRTYTHDAVIKTLCRISEGTPTDVSGWNRRGHGKEKQFKLPLHLTLKENPFSKKEES